MFLQKFLQDNLIFYQSFHSNTTNKIIHIITIPLVTWTILIWMANINFYTFHDVSPVIVQQMLNVNAGIILIGIYSIGYMFLDIVGSITTFIASMLQYFAANLFLLYIPFANYIALLIHLLAWTIQIIVGHFIFEKKSPAFVRGFIQAFTMAPLFVWLELLAMLGFKKYDQYHLVMNTEPV